MKKIFISLFVVLFVFSCSKVEEKTVVETPLKKEEVKVESKELEKETKEINKDFSSIKLTEINHENTWNNKNEFNGEYYFPKIKFSYPSDWDKNLAGDTETFSAHTFISKDGKSSFTIKNHYINDCKEIFTRCEENEKVKRTTHEKLNLLIEYYKNNYNSNDNNPTVKLNSFNYINSYFIDGIKTKAYESDNKLNYIFVYGDDIIEINFTGVDEDFVQLILSSIKSDEINLNIDKLQKVKNEYGQETYSGKFLTGMYLWEYEVNNLDKDIEYTLSGEIYDNYIQLYSKDKKFKKDEFVKLFEKFKAGDYVLVKADFEKNKELVPFYPTCCAWIDYIKFEVYKNGLLILEKGGNGGVGYSFSYITYINDKIYKITKDTGYYIEGNLYIDNNDKGEVVTEDIEKKLIGSFLGTEKYEDFQSRFENFKKEIDSLYE